jgi:hypothetical protein
VTTYYYQTEDGTGNYLLEDGSGYYLQESVPSAVLSGTQFVQSLNNQGWSIFQGMPIYTLDIWNGVMYFGALDGNVYVIQGDTDNQSIDGTNVGNAIASSMCGSFQDYEEPGIYHTGMFVRPVFLGAANPNYSIAIRYDYNISEILTPVMAGASGGSLWDVAIWDIAIWTGPVFEVESVNGVSGIGRAMAVALNMNTSAETTIIRYDLMFDSGGML